MTSASCIYNYTDIFVTRKYALFYWDTHLFVTFVQFWAFLKKIILPIAFSEMLQYNMSVTFFFCATEVLSMKTKAELIPECPVAATVQLIGNKWKLLIIRNLLDRPWRFNELQKNLEGISQKVLTDSLRSMEADGLITRTVYPEVPPRVEYALSELGLSLRPILDAMKDWGESYKALAR